MKSHSVQSKASSRASAYTDNSLEHKDQVRAFSDKRPEMAMQRKMQEMANVSRIAKQMQPIPAVQLKKSSNQAELIDKDLPASNIPNTSETQSGPYKVPHAVEADLGKRTYGAEPQSGGALWEALCDRNRQMLALPAEAVYDRAHIMANTFGGSGHFPNIVPTTAEFNRDQMWADTEAPLHEAKKTPYRAFRYGVDVEYATHDYLDCMLLAETYLPTAFNFKIDEFRFKGGDTESTDWNNWELTGDTQAAGSKVNYRQRIAHQPNFANFPAYKLTGYVNFQDPESIKANRRDQTAEEKKKYIKDKNSGFWGTHVGPHTNKLQQQFQLLQATNFDGLITDDLGGRSTLSLAQARCRQMRVAALKIVQNLDSFTNYTNQAASIAEWAIELDNYLDNALKTGFYNSKTVVSLLKDLQQIMSRNPMNLVQFDEEEEIRKIFAIMDGNQ